MIYSHLGSLVCNMIVSLIGQITGGVNDLHVIMCYKTVGINCTGIRKLQSDTQNKTRLNKVTHFNYTNKPLLPPLLNYPPPPHPSNKPALENTLNK